MKGKISELVWLYVKKRPFLKEIIREKTVNYSALARKISTEALGNKKYVNAVKMALQRLSSKLDKKEENLENDILSVLKNSSITLMSKIAVVVSSSILENIRPISFVKSRDTITYIIHQQDLEKVKKSRSIRLIQDTLNLITIHSPEELEDTPGVISMILGLLASEGINVVEFISCYTDTLLIVKESDTSRTYEIISELMV
ncbi:MAG: ACT domain-containing protein [Candidatus Micrarchaeota archaeon]|nr:ACT domain-containing protein [Candidatus Micrarchaeota archaeon]